MGDGGLSRGPEPQWLMVVFGAGFLNHSSDTHKTLMVGNE